MNGPDPEVIKGFQRHMRGELRQAHGYDLVRLAADRPDGTTIDPLVPHREHDRPREDWPTATLMELRPSAHPSLILDTTAARWWMLSEPYLEAVALVVGVGGRFHNGHPDLRVHAWAASERGEVVGCEIGTGRHPAGSGRNLFLDDLRGSWPPGTADDALFESIGYRTVR